MDMPTYPGDVLTPGAPPQGRPSASPRERADHYPRYRYCLFRIATLAAPVPPSAERSRRGNGKGICRSPITSVRGLPGCGIKAEFDWNMVPRTTSSLVSGQPSTGRVDPARQPSRRLEPRCGGSGLGSGRDTGRSPGGRAPGARGPSDRSGPSSTLPGRGGARPHRFH